MPYQIPGSHHTLDEQFHELIARGIIEARIPEMGGKLNQLLKGEERPIVGVPLLRGGLWIQGEIQKYLNFLYEPFPIKTKRYRGQVGGDFHMVGEIPTQDTVAGAVVIIFEDIVDEGVTMQKTIDFLRKLGAERVIVVSLLDKPAGRKAGIEIEIDVCGFEIESVFAFGCGMDDGKGNEYVRMLRTVYYYGTKLSRLGYKSRL